MEVNCYIVWDKATGEGAVIDPGADAADIERAVRDNGVKVAYIINTHGHFDHVGADGAVKERLGGLVAIHSSDEPILSEAHEHARFFGVAAQAQPSPDVLLKDGDAIAFGGVTLKVIHTPGHTRGGVCLYNEADKVLFTGDTLFAGSVGRTDFEGGSMDDLMRSIQKRILPLGDAVRVLPGHGPESTIGDEKEINPFLRGAKGLR